MKEDEDLDLFVTGWTLIDVNDTATNTNDEVITYGTIVELLSSESTFCQKVSSLLIYISTSILNYSNII